MTSVDEPSAQEDSVRFLAAQDFSVSEIASVLGVPAAEVRSVLAPGPAQQRGAPGRPPVLSADQVEEARQLRRDAGLTFEQIAEVFECSREAVRTAIRGGGDQSDEAAEADAPPMVEGAPAAGDAGEVWPPAPDGRAEWQTVWTPYGSTGAARGRHVRVRTVLLWGKRVLINERDEVWCADCLQFKTTVELGHPWNSCRVGLPRRGGIVRISGEEMERESSAPVESEMDRLFRIERGLDLGR